MFTFFHRTPNITLDCFTSLQIAYECTPIKKSSKTFPEYFKNIPKERPYNFFKNEKNVLDIGIEENLKSCYGFIQLFKKSLSIRNWCDIYIDVNEEFYEYYVSAGELPQSHSKEQIGKGFFNYHHIKLQSPWIFQEKSGVDFSWHGASWHLENYDFTVLPAITNYSFNCATHINIMLPKSVRKYQIPAGLPLVQITPLTEKNIIVKNHLISQKEFNERKQKRNYFNGWKTYKRLLKNEKDANSKCPFGF